MTDRELWLIIARALSMVTAAIEKRYRKADSATLSQSQEAKAPRFIGSN